MYFRDKSRERLESETSISLDPQKRARFWEYSSYFQRCSHHRCSFKTVLSGNGTLLQPVDPLASPISVQYSEGYTQHAVKNGK